MAISLRTLSSLIFRKENRILTEISLNGRLIEWSKHNRTTKLFASRHELYEFINSTVIAQLPIDYIEFGVYQGASLFKWAELNRNKESRFFGFDTFEGLPDPWEEVSRILPAGHFNADGKVPHTLDCRIRFVKGLFQRTLPMFLKTFEPKNRLVVHNDSDLYSSTLYCLTQSDRLLHPGSVLLFDQFYSASHEFRAFYDYTTAYRRTYVVLAAVGRNTYEKIALQIE